MAWNDGLEGPGLDFARSNASRLRALAGPGTGKTHSLLRRLARLLETGTARDELLILTFARTAALDIVAKLEQLEDEVFQEIEPKTLHSWCFGVLAKPGIFSGR